MNPTPDPFATSPGRPEAASAVWDPQPSPPGEEADAAPRRLRRRGLLQGAAGLAAAAAFAFFDRPVLAAAAGSLGFLTGIAAVFRPAELQRFLERVAERVGAVLAVVLLTPVYLLFFVPFGLLFRSGRRDRLERRFDREALTYWHRREPRKPGAAPFERQF